MLQETCRDLIDELHLLGQAAEIAVALGGDDHQVLDPHTQAAAEVDAGLDRDDFVGGERVLGALREPWGLVNLEADFYDKLAAYALRLDEAANSEAQKNPNSPKALLLQDELRKVRKRRDQIFTYRERKLALLVPM